MTAPAQHHEDVQLATIRILGQEYRIRSDADIPHLEQVAAHTGQKQPQKTGYPAFDHQVRAGQGAADENTEKGQQEKLE